jgi:hypothetical protein
MNYIRVIQQDNTCSQDNNCILSCYRDTCTSALTAISIIQSRSSFGFLCSVRRRKQETENWL